MRISDCSSDVCSSDLLGRIGAPHLACLCPGRRFPPRNRTQGWRCYYVCQRVSVIGRYGDVACFHGSTMLPPVRNCQRNAPGTGCRTALAACRELCRFRLCGLLVSWLVRGSAEKDRLHPISVLKHTLFLSLCSTY